MQVIRLNRTGVPDHFTTMPHSESQSDAEWIALDATVQMLEDRLGHSIVRSECVPRQDDPPDFRLTIEGIEYGVEVTIVSDGDNQQYAWFDEFITQLRIQVDQKNYQLGRVNVTLNQRPKMASKATFDLKVAQNEPLLIWHIHSPWRNPKNIAFSNSKKHTDFHLNPVPE